MTNRTTTANCPHRIRLLLCAALAGMPVATGCAVSTEELDVTGTEAAISASELVAVPQDWLGFEVGLEQPKWRRVGKLGVGGHRNFKGPKESVEESGPPIELTNLFPNELVTITSDGDIFQMELSSEELDAIGAETERRKLNEGSEGSVAEWVEKGWSLGVDTRVVWAGSTTFPRPTIGALVPPGTNLSVCTATLVDDRVIVTAAHCLVDGSGNTINMDFVANKHGLNDFTYGRVAWDIADLGVGFLTNQCYLNSKIVTTTCAGLDWAVARLVSVPRNQGTNVTAGFMGFAWVLSNTTFNGWAKREVGYPYLGDAPPVGNNDDVAYRDSNNCTTGTHTPNGNYARFKHGCDTSTGHSGGPIYRTSVSSVVGIESYQDCIGASCTTSNPNGGSRITSTVFNAISNYTNLY